MREVGLVWVCGLALVARGAAAGEPGRHILAEPTALCPQGSTLDGGLCKTVEYIEGTLLCPKGSHEDGVGGCREVGHREATLSCPPGSTLDKGKKCISHSTAVPLPSCPKGFESDGDAGCVRYLKDKAKEKCPAGYKKKGHSCERIRSVPSLPFCEAGQTLETTGGKGARCLSVEVLPLELVCPKGYEPDGIECRKLHTKTPMTDKCPKGFKKSAGGCTRHKSVPPLAACPPDAELNGKTCLRREIAQPQPECPKNMFFENGDCLARRLAEPIFSCPAGHRKKSEGGCVSVEKFAPEWTCPPGSVGGAGQCFEVLEAAPIRECDRGKHLKGASCVETTIVAPIETCPKTKKGKQSRRNGAGCFVEEVQDAQWNCPLGSLKGKSCMASSAIPAERLCKIGTLTERGCLTHKQKTPKKMCPPGAKKDGDFCVWRDKVEPLRICSNGVQPTHGKCPLSLTAAPELLCPKGHVLDYANNCILSEFQEPVAVCPPHTKLKHGMCVAGKK